MSCSYCTYYTNILMYIRVLHREAETFSSATRGYLHHNAKSTGACQQRARGPRRYTGKKEYQETRGLASPKIHICLYYKNLLSTYLPYARSIFSLKTLSATFMIKFMATGDAIRVSDGDLRPRLGTRGNCCFLTIVWIK